jgi:hypothetical protein
MNKINFLCPYCSQKLEATDELFGQILDCPTCKETIKVPHTKIHKLDNSEKKIGGFIAYYSLEDWWMSEFNKEEQAYIVSKFSPMGFAHFKDSLISGNIELYTTQTVGIFLRNLSGWFKSKPDQYIEKRIIAKAEEEGGEFWADKVTRLRAEGHCIDAITESMKYIPFPAAFRGIYLALRKEIRTRRKLKQSSTDLLKELHKWAVIDNFFQGTNYNRIINENILHSTTLPFVSEIKTPYEIIGYKKLQKCLINGEGKESFISILKQTDVKWLIEAFGEPKSHNTAQNVNLELWKQAVNAFKAAEAEDELLFWSSSGFNKP